jgi:GNAT superfamily N-acetyltransferase
MRPYQPSEIVRLWEDADDNLLGWVFVYPPWCSFDALLHPAHRGGDLEGDLLDWGEQETAGWMRREGHEDRPIRLEVFEGDTIRLALLKQRGYARVEPDIVIGVRSLNEPIPDATLPDGFSIRLIEDAREADKLVEAMNASFGWSWTAEEFRQVMQSPGYPVQLVVVAPDGRFASFCYLMLDAVNKIGMFEDVGTHPDFQRKGLGRALLYEGMKRMKVSGMDTPFVPHLASDEAPSRLYTSVGFNVQYTVYHYARAPGKE